MRVACPNCGSQVVFRSPALPVRVCDYCRTSVMRIDDGVRAMGVAAVLPFDVSPIRIGTRGVYDRVNFDVIGRVRWGWDAGSWNEWLLLFADGSNGWLGDAMGQFSVLRERSLDSVNDRAVSALARGDHVPVGTEAVIDGETFVVADNRKAQCIAAEGELPLVAPAGWSVRSVDFRSNSGAAATFQRDGEESSFYVGRYVTLAELQPQGLRAIDGWAIPAAA